MPADSRYKMPKETRKIGGKVYRYQEWRKTKAEAETYVENIAWYGRHYPSSGEHTVRLVHVMGGWAIYTRKGK